MQSRACSQKERDGEVNNTAALYPTRIACRNSWFECVVEKIRWPSSMMRMRQHTGKPFSSGPDLAVSMDVAVRHECQQRMHPNDYPQLSLAEVVEYFRTHKIAVSYVAGGTDPMNTTDEGTQRMPISISRPPAGLLHDTIPALLHRRTSRVGRACFLRGLINGEPRPLEYQPPGTTRTRRPRWFQEQHGWHQRWWPKEWKWVPSHRIERVPMRGLREGRESEVERERKTLLRSRRGHWQPK